MLLPDGDCAGAALLVNNGRGNWNIVDVKHSASDSTFKVVTNNIEVPGHGDHGVCVDLAHVVSLVLRLDVSDLQGPGVVAIVDDVEPGDTGDDVTPDGEDHLPVNVDPGNLRGAENHNYVIISVHSLSLSV